MKSIDKIPISKISRASKMLKTGAKVGVNYIKYYGDKVTKTEAEAKENLDKSNAEGIWNIKCRWIAKTIGTSNRN